MAPFPCWSPFHSSDKSTVSGLHCWQQKTFKEQQDPFLATGTGFIQLHSDVSIRQGQRGTGLIHTCIHCFYVNIKPLRDPQWVGSPRYNSNVTLCEVKEHTIFKRRCQENLFHVQDLCWAKTTVLSSNSWNTDKAYAANGVTQYLLQRIAAYNITECTHTHSGGWVFTFPFCISMPEHALINGDRSNA